MDHGCGRSTDGMAHNSLTWPDLTFPPVNLWSAPVGKPVQSPCIDVCRLDPTQRYCVGCGRTTEDLYRWLRMTDAEREESIRLAERRLWGDEGN